MDNNDKKEGIILKSTKYGDNSLIINILTHNEGLQAYIVKNVFGNKKNSRAALLQNANIVRFVAIKGKSHSTIGLLKDIEISHFYNSIPFDMNKTAVTMFICELCSKTIAGQESNDELYNYVRDSLVSLDEAEGYIANFPICFAIGLSRLLGFAPLDNYNDGNVFDMTEGRFVNQLPATHNYFFDAETSRLLSELIKTDTNTGLSLRLKGEVRRQMLDGLITFMRLHTPMMGNIQSHEVLRQVLS